jgi:DNA-binding response OmpR family regulator
MLLLNKHIVVIDDTHTILTFLRISLEALGATFHGAATAAGGIMLCETSDPDLVILDLNLPDQEGLKILPRLKHICKTKNLPVIILTAHRDAEARNNATTLGANAYVTKPFVMEDLLAVIQQQLKIKDEPGLTLVKDEVDTAV